MKVKFTYKIFSQYFIFFFCLFLIFHLNNFLLAQDPWPMPYFDAQATANSPIYGTDDPVIKWNAWTGYYFRPLALSKNGTLYSSQVYKPLYAISQDGTVKWQSFFSTSGVTEAHVPAIANDGTVYIRGGGYGGQDSLESELMARFTQ